MQFRERRRNEKANKFIVEGSKGKGSKGGAVPCGDGVELGEREIQGVRGDGIEARDTWASRL
eukprot:3829321-Pyramimonas_sp.AAC.1